MINQELDKYAELCYNIDSLKAQLKVLEEQQQTMRESLIDYMTENNTQSVSTNVGKAVLYPHKVAMITNPSMAMEYIKQSKRPELLQLRAKRAEVEQFYEAHGAYPPGFDMDIKTNIRITLLKGKKQNG